MRYIAGAVATLFVAGFLGAALIRFSPGYESDDRLLDMRYDSRTSEAIAKENHRDSNVFAFYGRYLGKAMHGDFGNSRSLGSPVGGLIRSRGAVTLRLLGAGLLAGWAMGLGLAALSSYFQFVPFALAAEAFSGAALSLPAAVFALIVFLARGPVFLVLAVAVFPKVFRYSRDLFAASRGEPRLEAARARGIPEPVIFRNYIVRPAVVPLIALAGVSFSIAFGALIPVEVVCDIPGAGQLAWKAAQARDLPVLVTLTLLVTAVTITVNGLAEWISQWGMGGERTS